MIRPQLFHSSIVHTKQIVPKNVICRSREGKANPGTKVAQNVNRNLISNCLIVPRKIGRVCGKIQLLGKKDGLKSGCTYFGTFGFIQRKGARKERGTKQGEKVRSEWKRGGGRESANERANLLGGVPTQLSRYYRCRRRGLIESHSARRSKRSARRSIQ